MRSILLSAALGLCLSTAANATTTCETAGYKWSDISSNVEIATDCQIGSTSNDRLNPMQVNLDRMFGHDDWSLIGRDENLSDGQGVNGFVYTGSGKTGSLEITDSAFDSYLLVLKGAAKGAGYVGYLIETVGNTSIDTPFWKLIAWSCKGIKATYQDISHATLYGRRDFDPMEAQPVPVPASLPLLALGLAALGLKARRRS